MANGTIMLNGISYSSGGAGSSDVELTKAEYDALGDEKLTNGINYFIKDWSQNESSGNSNIYSTEETIIGKWIDNRNVYRKVFTLNNDVTISSSTWFDTGLDWSNCSALHSWLIAIGGDGVSYWNYPISIDNSSTLRIMLYRSGNNTIRANSKIIIDYIKNDEVG